MKATLAGAVLKTVAVELTGVEPVPYPNLSLVISELFMEYLAALLVGLLVQVVVNAIANKGASFSPSVKYIITRER